MDIFAKLDAVIADDELGAVIPIFQKDGTPYLSLTGEPSTVTVVGNEATSAKKIARTQMRRAIRRAGQAEPEDIETNRAEKAAAQVIAWFGWDDGTTDVPCTPENVKHWLRAEHILAQVEAGITRHAAFLAPAPTR